MPAHTPAPYSEAILYAARAMKDGKANEGQQKAFLEWLMFGACRIRDVSYQPGDQLASAFAEGRRFVGLQVGALMDPAAVNGTVEALARARRAVSSREKRKTRQEAT